MTLRRGILLVVDLWLVALATISALALRDNLEINVERWVPLLTVYLPISLAAAGGVFVAGGLDRGLWRYSSIVDYLHIVVLTIVVVSLSVGLVFAINRLDGIPRSLPILQSILMTGALISARVTVRLLFENRWVSNSITGVSAGPAQTIIIVGISPLSELFLRSVRRYAPQQVRIAGVLAVDPVVRGRTIHRNEILGTVENLHGVLELLHVHGVGVNRIVVAVPRQRLSQRAIEVLQEVEASSGIVIQLLSQRLGLDPHWMPPLDPATSDRPDNAASCREPRSIRRDNSERLNGNEYLKFKRIMDVCVSALLISLLAPILPVVALVVAFDVGFPLMFWQHRPGLHGRSFRLYKFRTMRASHDKHFNRVPDEERLSPIGRFLRNFRIDELPQLYNILIGDMSIVGPRPLLPQDQSPNFATRLSVRPGLTGWAQVNGGRIISPTDKAMLDTWYVKNASFTLDLKIIFRTARMLLLGDRINVEAVSQAKQEFDRHLAILAE